MNKPTSVSHLSKLAAPDLFGGKKSTVIQKTASYTLSNIIIYLDYNSHLDQTLE